VEPGESPSPATHTYKPARSGCLGQRPHPARALAGWLAGGGAAGGVWGVEEEALRRRNPPKEPYAQVYLVSQSFGLRLIITIGL